MEQSQSSFEGWAIVEVFGHQRYAGFVTTQAFGQAVLFRVDVPPLAEHERTAKHYEYVDGKSVPPGSIVKEDAVQGYTKYFGPSAIYAMTPCSQDAAEQAVASMQLRNVSIVSLPPDAVLALPSGDDADDADDYDRNDDYDDPE